MRRKAGRGSVKWYKCGQNYYGKSYKFSALTRNQSQGGDSPLFQKCNKNCLYKSNKLTLVPLCSIHLKKITFSRLDLHYQSQGGESPLFKRLVEYSNVNRKNPQFDFKFDSIVKKLHPSLKKLGRINLRESVIQESRIPRLATDSGSRVIWQGIPAMRLKVIFSRCMEHRGTKVRLLSLYGHFLLYFQKSGEFPPCMVLNFHMRSITGFKRWGMAKIVLQ